MDKTPTDYQRVMSPAAGGKNKPVCKVCPKPRTQPEIAVREEDDQKEEDEEEGEGIAEDEGPPPVVEELCFGVDGYGDFDLVTTDHVLKEILPARRRKKPAFYASCAEKMRYDNLIPCDVRNDHQYEASKEKSALDQMSMLRVTSDPRWKRLPAIIATIGPSCRTQEQIQDLILSGMNVARINLAHGDRCSHLSLIRNVRAAEKNLSARLGFKTPIALMLDLKGPLILTGRICKLYVKDCNNPKMFLERGKQVKLTSDKYMADRCTPSLVYISNDSLTKFVRPGMRIFLDDGAVKLMAQKIEDTEIVCTVDEEGYLGNNRKVHLPMVPTTLPPYTPGDIEDLHMAIEEGVDVVTLPRASQPEAIQDLREKLTEKLMASENMRERPIMLLAKISTFEGLKNIDGVISAADGVVIQRGDLGLDMPPEKVVIAQKEIIAKCNIIGKPVICSTQLVHSMLDKIQVSRSDVDALACCIHDGADCVSLTHETAVGLYPNETIEMVNHVIREADASTHQRNHQRDIVEKLPIAMDPKIAIAAAACTVADKVRAPAIIVLTNSGKSAKFISWMRPRAVVLAVTPYERTARQMNLWRSIIPILYAPRCDRDWFMNMEMKFQNGIAYGNEYGFIRPGDPLVLVSGYGRDAGFTNCLRVIYASTEPGVYLDHPKEFYDSIYLDKPERKTKNKLPYTPCK